MQKISVKSIIIQRIKQDTAKKILPFKKKISQGTNTHNTYIIKLLIKLSPLNHKTAI